MQRKLLFSPLLIILFQSLVDRANPLLASASTPGWDYFGGTYSGGSNYIPDFSLQSHVTGFELGLTSSNAIFSVKILASCDTGSAIPQTGCNALSGNKHTLSVGTYERVTKIEAWRNNVDFLWYRLKITLHSLATVEYDKTPSGSANTLHTFTVPAGQEFTGFYTENYSTPNCVVSELDYLTRTLTTPSCCVFLDLTSFDGTSQNLVTDIAKTVQFTPRPWECGATTLEYQVTYTPTSTTPNLITLSASTPSNIVFAQSTNIADAKQYTVTLKARLAGSADWLNPAGMATATYNYIDLCAPTTLTAPTLTPMTTSVLKQASPGGSPFYETQTATATNSVSVSQSNPNFCGSYQYQISSTSTVPATALSATELTIDATSGLISLYTANSAAVGSHTATITAKLVNYPSITQVTTTFQISIQACLVTSYTMLTLSPAQDISYTIANSALTWQIPLTSIQITQVPACGHSETLTSTTAASFITPSVSGTGIDYTVQSNNLLDAGVHTVTVTSSITNQPFIFCQSTFTVTMIDPCPTTSISTYPALIENLVAFAGYTVVSKNKYTFNDAASVSTTLSPDLCGEKQIAFKLNGTATSYLQSENSDFIYFSPPENTTYYGVGQVIVQVSMKNYPTIPSLLISFEATILGSQTPKINDQTYNVNSSPLLVHFDQFKVIPQDYDAGPNKIEAYIYTGIEPLKFIDFPWKSFTNSSGLDWMQLDSQYSTLTISKSNSSNVGDHQIVLVQLFEQFTEVHPFTFFNIKIIAAPVLLDQMLPPYFVKELVPQNVTQCPGQNATMWSFLMPRQIDPQNQTVTMTLSFDKTFFSYQMNETTIKQIMIIQEPTNKTINATLINKSGLKASFSMEVHFVCNITKNFTFKFQVEKLIAAAVKQEQWPKARISRIEPSGLLHVKFLQSMKIPEHPELIMNETILLNDTYYPIVDFVVVTGKLNDPHMTRFNWTFVSYTQQELLIQLDFEHINYISSRISDPDSIQVTIYGVQFFQDTLGNWMLPRTILKLKELPPLASKFTIQETIELVTITKYIVASFAAMLFISGPVQQILSSFRHTQIIVHIILIKVNQPATSLVFFSGLMELVNFQLIDTSNFYNRIFSLDPDSNGNNPYSNQFEIMGYGSLYIVQNLGLLLITLFTPLIVRIALFFVVLLFGDSVKIWKYDLSSMKEMSVKWLQYGFLISFLDETYLFLLVCAGLNLSNQFEWIGVGDVLNSLLSIFVGIILVVFPIFVAYFYRKEKNYERITNGDQDFKARFGSIIEGLNFKRRQRWALFYPCLSLCRKIWLAYILVFQKDKPVLCIFCVIVQALLMIAVTGVVEPMTEISKNRMQLFNEVFVVIISYHLIPLTEFMTDLELRNNVVGKSLIGVTLFNLAVNIGLASIQNSIKTKRRFQKWIKEIRYRKAKKKADKREKLKQAQLKEAIKAKKAERRALRLKIKLKDEQVERRRIRAEEAAKKVEEQKSQLIQPERITKDAQKVQKQNRLNNQSPQFSHLLESKESLMKAFTSFTEPKKNSDRNRQQMLLCNEKVQKFKLGADLKPLGGLIQGPITVVTHFNNPKEVVFVFEHPLKPKDYWNGEQMRQLAKAAVDVRAVSNIPVPNQLNPDLVSLKVKQEYVSSIGQAITKGLGTKNPKVIYGDRGNYRSVILDREDSLEELHQKFKGLVNRKILFELVSGFHKTVLKVYMIKVDVELVRFGILVDGIDKHKVTNVNDLFSKQIEQQLSTLLRKVQVLSNDFPKGVQDDIMMGKFTGRIKQYVQERDSRSKPPGYRDFGRVTDSTSFEEVVRIYVKICENDELNSRTQQRCDECDFI